MAKEKEFTQTQNESTAAKQGEKAFKTMCGGQALIEGIMMRGPEKQAIVIRKPDGQLEIAEKKLSFMKQRYPILGLPLIRGCVNFGGSMYNGMKALIYSAQFLPEDEQEQPSKFEQWLESKFGSEKMASFVVLLAVLLGGLMSVGLFFILPTVLGTAVTFVTSSVLARNLAEAVAKIVIFLGYLFLCSKMKDIQRVFAYHGAEHKTIFCYEAGLPLTVENVRKQPRHHPRCGTSFLFVVIFLSILVSTIAFHFYPVHGVFARIGAHLLLLPIIVGVGYEFNRWAGRHTDGITRILIAPGLWLQNFTTFEPDDQMIEVGIRALELVLPEEKGKDAW